MYTLYTSPQFIALCCILGLLHLAFPSLVNTLGQWPLTIGLNHDCHHHSHHHRHCDHRYHNHQSVQHALLDFSLSPPPQCQSQHSLWVTTKSINATEGNSHSNCKTSLFCCFIVCLCLHVLDCLFDQILE